jgi:hypothetical protein
MGVLCQENCEQSSAGGEMEREEGRERREREGRKTKSEVMKKSPVQFTLIKREMVRKIQQDRETYRRRKEGTNSS